MHQSIRINALQGLRAVAFVIVFLFHSGICPGGQWAVSVFFVLSGFVMTYNYFPKEDTIMPEENWVIHGAKFAWRKIRKLYSLYIVTIILCAFLNGYTAYKNGVFLLSLPGLLLNIVLNVLLLQVWVPFERLWGSLNGPAWFLCVIFFCYFCFSIILPELKKIKRQSVYAIIVISSVLEILVAVFANMGKDLLSFFDTWFAYYFPVTRFLDFFMGCLLGIVFLNRQSLKKWSIVYSTLIELVVVLFSIFCIFGLKRVSEITGVNINSASNSSIVYLPASTALVFVLSHQAGGVSKILSSKWFVLLGNISSYAFLIHMVVIKYCQIAAYKYIPDLGGIAVSGFSLIITIVFSIIWGDFIAG